MKFSLAAILSLSSAFPSYGSLRGIQSLGHEDQQEQRVLQPTCPDLKAFEEGLASINALLSGEDSTNEILSFPNSVSEDNVLSLIDLWAAMPATMGTNMFPPQAVRNIDGATTVKSVGGSKGAGIDVCDYLGFMDGESIAFGIEGVSGTQGFCAAFNTCTHTYAFAQEGIIPSINIGLFVSISLDAAGFSLDKTFSLSSHNEMLTGDYGVYEQVTVPGHVIVKGNIALGIDWGESTISMALVGAGEIVVDADLNNNGVVPVFSSDGDSISLERDYALLIKGNMYPQIIVFDYELYLNNLLDGKLDVYVRENGSDDREWRIGASLSTTLQGLCDLHEFVDLFLCEAFDGTSGITGRVAALGNSELEFGLEATISGNIKTNDGSIYAQFLDFWPSVDEAFDVVVTIDVDPQDGSMTVCSKVDYDTACVIITKGDDGATDLCVTVENELENTEFTYCFDHCNDDTGCDWDEYCEEFLIDIFADPICIKKKGYGEFCGVDGSVCTKGYCGASFTCVDCPTVNSNEGCDDDQHCNISGQCIDDKDYASVCTNDDECSGGHCVSKVLGVGWCANCPIVNSNTGCDDDEHCDASFKCIADKGTGSLCTNDDECKNGSCNFIWCN